MGGASITLGGFRPQSAHTEWSSCRRVDGRQAGQVLGQDE